MVIGIALVVTVISIIGCIKVKKPVADSIVGNAVWALWHDCHSDYRVSNQFIVFRYREIGGQEC